MKKRIDDIGIDLEIACLKYNNGISYREIAKETTCSVSTVTDRMLKYAEEHGIELKKPNRIQMIDDMRLADVGKIKALYRAKWSVEEIHWECQVTERVVRQVLCLD